MADFKNVAGLAELRNRMLELPKRLDRRILNKALMPGAQLIANDARSRAPVLAKADRRRRPGTLRDAIKAQAGRPDPEMGATVLVRVRPLTKTQVRKFKTAQLKKGNQRVSGANNPADPFYWRFNEFGTSKLAARPFLRPAFESQKAAAVDTIKPALEAAIDAEVRKLNPGGK